MVVDVTVAYGVLKRYCPQVPESTEEMLIYHVNLPVLPGSHAYVEACMRSLHAFACDFLCGALSIQAEYVGRHESEHPGECAACLVPTGDKIRSITTVEYLCDVLRCWDYACHVASCLTDGCRACCEVECKSVCLRPVLVVSCAVRSVREVHHD
ncbi:hypothetical protein KAT92_05290 [Candidatus Babeliales bacterium]|nr:hypothetical protein [Candidatus Babeliales bacterium]